MRPTGLRAQPRDRPAIHCRRGQGGFRPPGRCYNPLVAKRKEPFNVFYVLLLVVGVLFALTAFAYFVMATRARSTTIVERAELMRLLDRNGGTILAIELAILAVCTVGAIGWDHVVGQRNSRSGGRDLEQPAVKPVGDQDRER